MFEVPLPSGPVQVTVRDPADNEIAGRWRFAGGARLEVDFLAEQLCTVDGQPAQSGGVIPGFIPWPRLAFEINGRRIELTSDDPEVLRRHYGRPNHQEVSYARPNRYLLAFHQARLQQVRRLLAGVSGKVLDVGSGHSLVNAAGPWPFQLFSCDRDIEAIRSLHERGIPAVRGSAAAPPFAEGAFDAVFAGEIVEHLPDPQAALSAWVRSLKPGGRLVVTTPNRRHLLASVSHREQVQNPEHLFEYSAQELQAAVTRAGGTVTRLEGLCLPLPLYAPGRGWRNAVQLAGNHGWVPQRALTRYFGLTRRIPSLCENLAVVAECR